MEETSNDLMVKWTGIEALHILQGHLSNENNKNSYETTTVASTEKWT